MYILAEANVSEVIQLSINGAIGCKVWQVGLDNSKSHRTFSFYLYTLGSKLHHQSSLVKIKQH